MGTVLRQLNLVVADMPTTLAFYRRLGVSIPDDAVWPAGGPGHHVEVPGSAGVSFEFDSLELTRTYDGDRHAADDAAKPYVVFSVASRHEVDERYGALTSEGAPGRCPPFDAFWGARYAIVEDPDGHLVGIMSPVDPARRSAPPDLESHEAAGRPEAREGAS